MKIHLTWSKSSRHDSPAMRCVNIQHIPTDSIQHNATRVTPLSISTSFCELRGSVRISCLGQSLVPLPKDLILRCRQAGATSGRQACYLLVQASNANDRYNDGGAATIVCAAVLSTLGKIKLWS